MRSPLDANFATGIPKRLEGIIRRAPRHARMVPPGPHRPRRAFGQKRARLGRFEPFRRHPVRAIVHGVLAVIGAKTAAHPSAHNQE
jgi:hypothetical protein